VVHITKVKTRAKVHILPIAPRDGIIPIMADYLGDKHQRGIMKLNEMVDWVKAQGGELGEELT
jgi:hypothetical protein